MSGRVVKSEVFGPHGWSVERERPVAGRDDAGAGKRLVDIGPFVVAPMQMRN